MMMNREAPQGGLANLMAMKGRYGDTELVHMSKPEVQGLASLGEISINPDTGLPEAFSLGGVFKTIVPMATTAIGGYFGGPMGAAAGNAIGNYAVGERDTGKLALGAMMSFGMGSMSAAAGGASSGAGSAAAKGASAGFDSTMGASAGDAAGSISNPIMGSAPSGVSFDVSDFGSAGLNPASASPFQGFDSTMGASAGGYQGVGGLSGLAQPEIMGNGVPNLMSDATPQQLFRLDKGQKGLLGLNKIAAGNHSPSDLAGAGIDTLKDAQGNYTTASDMGMSAGDYAMAQAHKPSTYLELGTGLLSNGVFDEKYDAPKTLEGEPTYVPRKLTLKENLDRREGQTSEEALKKALIGSPKYGGNNFRYVEAAEGGLIALAEGGYVDTGKTLAGQGDDPLGLDGSLVDLVLGGAPGVEVDTGKTVVGGLRLDEFGNGKHTYTQVDPISAPAVVVEESALEDLLDADDPMHSGDSDGDSDGGSGGGSSDGSGSSSGDDEGNDIATGGLVGLTNKGRKHLQRRAEGGIIGLAEGGSPRPRPQAKPLITTDPNEYYESLVKPAEFDNSKYKSKEHYSGKKGSGSYKVYLDSLDKPTIGPGVLVTKALKKKLGMSLKVGDAVPQSTIDPIAKGRWDKALNDSMSFTDGEEILPLAEMVYQQGKKGVSKYVKTLKHIKNKDYVAAGEEAMNSNWAKQTNKRAREVTNRLKRHEPKVPMFSEGGGISGYFEGQVVGQGDGMSDQIPYEVEGDNPDKALLSPNKALLSRDEYVIPADAVAMLGNGSSNAGAENLDSFVKNIRQQSFGTEQQQRKLG